MRITLILAGVFVFVLVYVTARYPVIARKQRQIEELRAQLDALEQERARRAGSRR